MASEVNPHRDAVRRLILDEHKSYAQVGKALGISRNAVCGLATRMGINKRQGDMSHPIDMSVIIAAARLMREGKGMTEVGEALGLSSSAADRVCRKARALTVKNTAPRSWAYTLAAFDPVVARAVATYEALR